MIPVVDGQQTLALRRIKQHGMEDHALGDAKWVVTSYAYFDEIEYALNIDVHDVTFLITPGTDTPQSFGGAGQTHTSQFQASIAIVVPDACLTDDEEAAFYLMNLVNATYKRFEKTIDGAGVGMDLSIGMYQVQFRQVVYGIDIETRDVWAVMPIDILLNRHA